MPLPLPRPVELKDVEWVVIELPDGDVYIATTPAEYEDLAENLTELIRWIEEAMFTMKDDRDAR